MTGLQVVLIGGLVAAGVAAVMIPYWWFEMRPRRLREEAADRQIEIYGDFVRRRGGRKP